MSEQPVFIVYSRAGCHLCEVLLEELQPLVRGRGRIEVVDIDTRADCREQYDTRVPVLEKDGVFLCQYRLDKAAVLASLPPRPRDSA